MTLLVANLKINNKCNFYNNDNKIVKYNKHSQRKFCQNVFKE